MNLPSIIIGEDDLKFSDVGAFTFFIKNEPEDYDIYLSGIYHGKIKSDNTVDDFCGLTLYKIRERFYKTFLSVPEDQEIDRALAGKGKFIVCNPFVATQIDGYSDNKKEFCKYASLLLNRNLYSNRRL